MHMLSKKGLSSDDMETLRRSRNCTTVVTANGEAQTNEEAQENFLFVTVQILDDTLADWENSAMNTDILTSGSAVKNHGWPNREDNYICETDNFVPLVVF